MQKNMTKNICKAPPAPPAPPHPRGRRASLSHRTCNPIFINSERTLNRLCHLKLLNFEVPHSGFAGFGSDEEFNTRSPRAFGFCGQSGIHARIFVDSCVEHWEHGSMVLHCAPRLELLLVLALDDTKSLSSSRGSSYMGVCQNENLPPPRGQGKKMRNIVKP